MSRGTVVIEREDPGRLLAELFEFRQPRRARPQRRPAIALAGRSSTGQLQPRLVRPQPGRLPAGAYGDVLVSLARGLAGKGWAATIARSLGLRRWGDQVLGLGRDEAWFGQVLQISHLVTITFLGHVIEYRSDRDHDWRGAPQPRHLSSPRELLMSEGSGDYKAHDVSGYLQRLHNDEYVHLQLTHDRRTIMWSTEQPLAEFAVRVSLLLPAPGDEVTTLVEPEADPVLVNTAAFLDELPIGSRHISLIRAGFPGTTVFWRRPFHKIALDGVAHAEGGFAYEPGAEIDRGQLRAALLSTASPILRHIVELQPALLAHVIEQG